MMSSSNNNNNDDDEQQQQHQQSYSGEGSKQQQQQQQQQQLATIAPLSTLLPPPHLQTIISSWLQDDVPSHFDVGGYVVGSNIQVAELYMKSSGVLAGIPFFNAVFAACGECVVQWEDKVVEGMGCYGMGPGDKMKLATVTGPVSHLLRGERTALNTLSRCSGVASVSRLCANLAKAVAWHGEVAGTRKTTPGPFRTVEKYGLLVGGASTHRLDLSQMVMLKDNHIWACHGSIEAAVHKARSACGFSCKIEVECQSLDEALLAAKAGANIIMLDNYTLPSKLKEDAKLFKEQYPHVLVEASGGITMETLGEYMCEYVDVISLGMLTQGYNCVDYSLKIVH